MISLNLLPPAGKAELAGKRRNRKITTSGALLVGLLLVGTAALFGASLYVGTQVSAQKRRIEETKTDLARFAEIESLILAVRDRVTTLSSQEKNRQLWSEVVGDLAAATPAGIQLAQLSFTTASAPQLQLSGEADNKETIASLRERLEASDRFENVAIRQIGQTEDEFGNPISTFSMEGSLTGVAAPRAPSQPQGVGE